MLSVSNAASAANERDVVSSCLSCFESIDRLRLQPSMIAAIKQTKQVRTVNTDCAMQACHLAFVMSGKSAPPAGHRLAASKPRKHWDGILYNESSPFSGERSSLPRSFRKSGEMAEWLKAAVC